MFPQFLARQPVRGTRRQQITGHKCKSRGFVQADRTFAEMRGRRCQGCRGAGDWKSKRRCFKVSVLPSKKNRLEIDLKKNSFRNVEI